MHTTVVGGGVIGLATAWRLAQAGGTVTVVDPDPGRGASWAAAGMLAPVTEAHYGEEALLALNLASQRRWPSFAAELAEAAGRGADESAARYSDVGYRDTGTLSVARDRDDLAALAELAAYHERLGLPVERLTSREVRRLEPGLAPATRGGLFVAGDHQVDNRALVEALLAACRRAGVTLVRDRVTALQRDGDHVCGVTLAGGGASGADAVVLAAGCWSAAIEGLPGGAVPVRPVKGQVLHLRGAAADVPSRVVRGLDVYVVPRADGRVVVGATVEERGADTTVTAEAVHELLRAAVELLPALGELEFVEAVAGLRPGTPDNAPMLGPVAGVDGLVVATGHYRNGILLTPVTADGIAACVTGGTVPDVLAPFTPDRFLAAEARPAAAAGVSQ